MTFSALGIPTLLALGAAVAYGVSDFIGGLTSRRERVWAVAATSQAVAAAIALPFVLTAWTAPTPTGIGWALLAGLGAAVGNLLIYHGLAVGRVLVVAPLAAVTSTVLPVLVDILSGQRLSAVLMVGVMAAVTAGWLVSAARLKDLRAAERRTMVVGLLAGAGFGAQFAALGQVPPGAGLTPVALSQLISVGFIIGVAQMRHAEWRPRSGKGGLAAAAAGALAGTATLLFQTAAQAGPLTTAVVLTSLYPAVTVTLGAAVFHERTKPIQAAGLILTAVAIVLIKLG